MDVYDLILECFECAIHQMLRTRFVYDQSFFERRRIYGSTALYQCEDPDVISYIARILKNTRPILEEGTLENFIFYTYNADGNCRDQVHIRVIRVNTQKIKDGIDSVGISAEELHELQTQARNLMLKLAVIEDDGLLTKLDPGDNWTLLLSCGLLPTVNRPENKSRAQKEKEEQPMETGESKGTSRPSLPDNLGKACVEAMKSGEWCGDTAFNLMSKAAQDLISSDDPTNDDQMEAASICVPIGHITCSLFDLEFYLLLPPAASF
jgi:hypothetical protein